MNLPSEQETIQYFTELLSTYRLNGLVERYCAKHDLSMHDITSKKRKQGLVHHRHKIAKLAKDKNYTLTEIGDALNRDHSTIKHYLDEYTPIS